MEDHRKDELLAQKTDIGLIFRRMLGEADARHYLNSENVPPEVIERVLADQPVRNGGPSPTSAGMAPAAPPSSMFYCSSGRRKDVIRAAIVQAALAVRDQYGDTRAEQLLRREKLPDDVIARVLGDELAARRAR